MKKYYPFCAPARPDLNCLSGKQRLPDISGSVMLLSQSGGLTIAQTSGAPNNPLFTITATDGAINFGNEIRFAYQLEADCTVPAGTVIYPVDIVFNGQLTTGEVIADILEADSFLTAHPLAMAAIGTPLVAAMPADRLPCWPVGARRRPTPTIGRTTALKTRITIGRPSPM